MLVKSCHTFIGFDSPDLHQTITTTAQYTQNTAIQCNTLISSVHLLQNITMCIICTCTYTLYMYMYMYLQCPFALTLSPEAKCNYAVHMTTYMVSSMSILCLWDIHRTFDWVGIEARATYHRKSEHKSCKGIQKVFTIQHFLRKLYYSDVRSSKVNVNGH